MYVNKKKWKAFLYFTGTVFPQIPSIFIFKSMTITEQVVGSTLVFGLPEWNLHILSMLAWVFKKDILTFNHIAKIN